MKDNFWEMGETGPCGPCSELHFDRIGGREVPELVNQDDPDVLEIWNLVFIQYNRETDGSLASLPKKHIDCGLGLERLVSVIQDKRSNYDTDLFMPLFQAIQEGTGAREYQGRVGSEDTDGIDMAYRVLADHARTITIALADGGVPDNTGRGYVLRRILRRAVRYATEKLQAKPGFFSSLVNTVISLLGDVFPEINRDPQAIIDIINEEEIQFLKTLTRGRNLLNQTIQKRSGDGSNIIPGDLAWRLYDTYGFPVDLTQLMCEEKGLNVDMEGYEVAKKRAQLLSQGTKGTVDEGYNLDVHSITDLQNQGLPPTDDTLKYDYKADNNGKYDFGKFTAKVIRIRCDKQFVNEISSGQMAGVLLDKTNFYAEQGGQIYDEGFLEKVNDNSVEFAVKNVQVRGGYILHIGSVEGTLRVGDEVILHLDTTRRQQVMKNHTGTHLLNYGLRKCFGEKKQCDQRGSLVAPDKLRFDFTNNSAMSPAEVKKTEQFVIEKVKANDVVYSKESALSLAKTIKGLRAVFDETYPDPVKIVSVGVSVDDLENDPFSDAGTRTSVEFCGGTHIHRTGHIGDFVISSEEAIGKGIRRIVALTGFEATKAVKKGEVFENELKVIEQNIKNSQNKKEIQKNIIELLDDISHSQISYWKKDELRLKLNTLKRDLDKDGKKAEGTYTTQIVEELKNFLKDNVNIPVLVRQVQADSFAKALDTGVKQAQIVSPETSVMLFSVDATAKKIICLANVPEIAVKKGLKANEWVQTVTPLMGGKGGGKPHSAQGSGNNITAVNDAVQKAIEFANSKLSS